MAVESVEYVCYFYGGKFAGPELTIFRCPNCSRKIFNHNSKRIAITNAYGAGTKEIAAGTKDDTGRPVMIEYQCHGCKSLYKILFS